MVQESSQAQFDSMPRSALEYIEADHVLPSTEMGAKLHWLVQNQAVHPVEVDSKIKSRLAKEIEIAARDHAFQKGIMAMGEPTPFTCPECHGVLVRIDEGDFYRFRCHTGHAYTGNALLEGVAESIGKMLWQVIRSFEEAVMLLNQMGDFLKSNGDQARAASFFATADELEEQSKTYHSDVLRHGSLRGDNLGQKVA